ncbi:MAG: hypothetical protein ACREOG_17355 [Gemmatimonadaceae bacterium]
MPASALSGKRVLLIMISRSNPESVWLITGRGQLIDSTFQVVPDSGAAPVAVVAVDLQDNAFEPTVLPHLVGEETYLPLARQLADDVARCIPMFVDQMPVGAKPVPGFLGGLATGPNGKIFLMQVR